MQISFIRSPEEVLLHGSRQELQRLAEQIVVGHGSVQVNSIASVAEDVEVLVRVTVTATDDRYVTIAIDETSRSLAVRGDEGSRRQLAASLREAIGALRAERHWHLEHEPGHPFLSTDSMPVVVGLDD